VQLFCLRSGMPRPVRTAFYAPLLPVGNVSLRGRRQPAKDFANWLFIRPAAGQAIRFDVPGNDDLISLFSSVILRAHRVPRLTTRTAGPACAPAGRAYDCAGTRNAGRRLLMTSGTCT